MNKIRYLTMTVVCMIMCITANGQGDFNPVYPSEPGAPDIKYPLVIEKTPEEGGSVTGSGSYSVGRNVTVRATANSGYTFEAWADKEGIVLSTSSSFSYVTKEKKDTLVAHFCFTPSSPSEPQEPSTTLYYRLNVVPMQGCTVSGGGRYLSGKSISVSATVESGYTFVNWTDANGDVVSTSREFSYVKKADNETLTANVRFDPSAPTEPGNPILQHWVKATCTDGGTVSGKVNDRVLTGNTFSLSAKVNAGYEFMGWYLNNELYTKLLSFSYVMGDENLQFEARFRFNPSSPSEPLMPAISTYSYYLPTVNGTPGSSVSYAINLVNTEVVKDMNIRLTFPEGMNVVPTDYVVSDKATGYTISVNEGTDDISLIEEGATLWDFTFIGGTTEPATHPLLTFKVLIPEDMKTGESRQVKINQVSMMMADGNNVTAHTRNGRIGVYKMCDVNGDDTIDITDVLGTLGIMKGSNDENIIREVADPNADGNIDITDVLGVLEIMKSNAKDNTDE